MLKVLLWALGTGFITGAVWMAIVLWRRETKKIEPATLDTSPPDPLSVNGEGELPSQADRARLEDVTRRLLEVEERLDATEQRLLREREKIEQLRKRPE